MSGKKENRVARNYARHLFTTERWTQQDIAVEVGVSETTISTWKKEDKWDSFVNAELAERDMLDDVVQQIAGFQKYHRELPVEKQYQWAGKYADALYKLNRVRLSILSWLPIDLRVRAITALAKYVAKVDPELADRLLPIIDSHIREINEELK